METLLDLFSSVATGGLFGILGGLGTAWLKAKSDEKEHQYKLENKKLDHSYNLQMITAETDATIKEVEANVKRDQIIMDGQADIEESKGRNKAILKLSENYVKQEFIDKMMFNTNKWTSWLTIPIAIFITLIHGIVDISRTLVRVIITYSSVAFSFFVLVLAFEMYTKLGLKPSPDQLYAIIIKMINLLTFTTSTAIGFWFMDKSMSRKFQNIP